MAKWVCAALALALGLAGCIDAGTTDEEDDPGADPGAGLASPGPFEPLPWTLSDCQAAVIFFDVPAERVQPHLPEGFSPVPVAQGLADQSVNPTDGGSFGVEMFTCESGTGLNETVEGIVYGSYFAFATPPADLAHSDVDYHFVKWDTVIPDETRREHLERYGAPVHNGSASFGTFTLQGPIGSMAGTLEMNGTHHFSGDTVAPGPDQVRFVEYMETPGGLMAWTMHATTTASGLGPGSYTPAPGSLAAEVLGTGLSDGNLMMFTGAFETGEIRLIGP